MPTTPPCRCSTSAARAPADYGHMCATTGRSPAPIRRRRPYFYSARSHRQASRGAPGFLDGLDAGRRLCRLQPACTRLAANPRKSSGPPAGPMRGASSSTWRGSTRAPIAIEAVARIDALFAIERDINGLSPRRAAPGPATSAAGRASRRWAPGYASSSTPGSRPQQPGRPRRSPTASTPGNALVRFLDDGRLCMTNNAAGARPALQSPSAATTDIRRFRQWRPPRRSHLHPDRDRKAQRRRRSPGLARRRPGAPAGSPRQAHRRVAALELEAAATAAAASRAA